MRKTKSGRNLIYPSGPGDATATIILLGSMTVLLAIAASFLTWLTATEIAKIPSGTASWVGIVFGPVAIAGTVGAMYFAALVRPFSVHSGIMTLQFPIKRASGRRSRLVMFTDIRQARRLTSETGDAGVLFTLVDGTRFSVFDADLQTGGTEFLNELVAAIDGPGIDEAGRKDDDRSPGP